MIAGSQGHRRFRPNETGPNECGSSEAIVSKHEGETCDRSLRKQEESQTDRKLQSPYFNCALRRPRESAVLISNNLKTNKKTSFGSEKNEKKR